MSTLRNCKNCEQAFDSSYKYCPYCGQESSEKLTFTVLFKKTIENYLSIDGRFFKSLFTLLFQPGVIARRFVDGKRQTYMHPARFYLFISIVFFFIFSFSVRKADNQVSAALKKGFEDTINLDSTLVQTDSINLDIADNPQQENRIFIGTSPPVSNDSDSLENSASSNSIDLGFDRPLLDSLIAAEASLDEKYKAMGMNENANSLTRKFYAQILKFYEKQGGGMLQALYDTIPVAMFLLLPLFAFLLKVFYWKSASYAEHIVFTFYSFTFLFISLSIMILINKGWELPTDLITFICFSFIIYLILALRNFYKRSWIGAFFKANMISFLYMLVVMPVAAIGIILIAFLLY